MVNTGGDGVGIQTIGADLSDVGVGSGKFVMNIGEGYIRVSCEFSLEAGSQQLRDRRERMDLKDAMDLVEIQLPGRNCLFVTPCMELSE